MSEDVLLQVVQVFGKAPCLMPSDTYSLDVLDTMPNWEIVRCEISRPRNRRHHNLAMGLLRKVYEAQSLYSTPEAMLDHIKIIMGHYDSYTLDDGTKIARPRSIAWHMMDQTEFEHWWNKFLDVILTRILPLTNRADLEQRVYEILGGPTPDDIR